MSQKSDLRKNDFREKIKVYLKQLSASAKTKEQKELELSKNLFNYLDQHLNLNDSTIHIGVFDPIQAEPKWFSAFDCDQIKAKFCYPSNLDKQVMDFVHLEKFTTGFGIDLKGEPVGKLDIVVIPGLAFSESGLRLGRGGGFYDRYLVESKALKVGICFEGQLFDEIPFEEHDIKMDLIITENRIIRCK